MFLSLTHDLVANVHRVQIFQDKDRTKLLAAAESSNPEDTVSLLPQNNSDLFGSIRFAYTEDTASIEIVAIPRLLSWRLRRLRSLWRQQDRPADPYSDRLLPVIDPDLVGPDNFRPTEPGQPQPVLTRWQARRAEIDALFAATKAARENNIADADGGVDAALAMALGRTLAELKAIKADLDQNDDAAKRLAAQATITTALHLTAEAFARLVTLLDSAASLEPAQWEEVYAILTQAQKVALFPTWLAEEQGEGLALGMKDFWIALSEPQNLPKWLATTEARQAWQQALRQRSQPAIIDPDTVPATYLADPLVGPARTRWKERYDAMAQLMKDYADQLKAVQQNDEDELAHFDSILEKAVGVPASRLLDLDAKRRKGEAIEKELAQLTLGNAALNFLLRLRSLLEKGEQVLDTEWKSVFSILVQVWKERQFAGWRDAEGQDGITLSQDYLRLPVPPETVLELELPEQLPEWRATWLARRDWEDKLQARIDAEQTIFAGLADAINTTEESTLISLRDALIQASAAPGASLDETAESLTDRLLIDTKVGSCQKTTRVAQAIETLQLLLFRLRSGQIRERRDWTLLQNSPLVRPGSEPLSAPLTFAGTTDHALVLVGNDNRIYNTFASIMFGGPWRHVGAATNHTIPANSRPSLFSFENGGKVYLFATGDDGFIHFTLSEGGNEWPPWSAVGDLQLRTDARITVAGAVLEELVHVFVVRDDGQIHSNWWDGQWHDWTRIGNEAFSVPTNAVLGAASLKDEVHLFVAGNDGKILKSQVNRNVASDWTVVDAAGSVVFSPGAAVAAKGTGSGDALVELVAVATDGGIYRSSWNEMMGDWTAWAREGTLTVSTKADVTMAGSIGNIQLFVVGKNGRVYWKANQDWEAIGDTTVTPGAVAARLEPAGAQHLYVSKWETVLTTSRSAVGAPWNLSVLALTLQAPQFDQEWKWIGSYATWRAAMFVFLYPENLLLPNLKQYKTPAFDRLLENLRSNRRLTPENACAAAREYADYVKDVCSLTVEATCQTKTKIYKQGSCQAVAVEERHLLYLFGRTPSGKVYWSVFDPGEKSGYPQKAWRLWPFGEIALAIRGTAPYMIDAARRFIYLFFIKKESVPAGPNLPPDIKISFARFDLNRQDWDGNITDLPDPPVFKTLLRVVVYQGLTEKFPPLLGMWPSSSPKQGGVIQRPLNSAGDGWRPSYDAAKPEWEQFIWYWGEEGSPGVANFVKPLLPLKDYHAALTDEFGYTPSSSEHFVTARNDGLYKWYEEALGGNEWLGMYVIGSANEFDPSGDYRKISSLAFFRQAGTGNPICARSEYGKPDVPNEGKITPHQTLFNLVRVIPNWGSAPAAEARVAYMRKTDLATVTCCCRLSQAPDGISGRKPTLVLPALPNNEPI